MTTRSTNASENQNTFLLSEIPKISRFLALLLGSMYILGLLIPSSQAYLALIPGYTIPPHFYVWNIVTSGYFEVSAITASFHIVGVLLFGRYLEPMWGSLEFIKFILVVNSLSGIATFLLMVFAYILWGDENLWFSLRMCGFSSVVAGFTVAIKQLIPEQELGFSVVTIRAKHFPGVLLLVHLALYTVTKDIQPLILAILGIGIGWTYLRFYQKKSNVVGDMNESFAFVTFFPEPVRPFVAVISNVVYGILKLLRVCPNQPAITSNLSQVSSPPMDMDSERRRAIALKALDERLQQQASVTSLNSLDSQV